MPKTPQNEPREIQNTMLALVSLSMAGFEEIAKCEVTTEGAIAMKHIAETSLVNLHKMVIGESFEG